MKFVDRVKELQAPSRWARPRFPDEIVSEWDQFVEGCEDGYEMGLAEYENDLMIRNLADAVLSDPELNSMDEIDRFRRNIADIDERFRNLLTPLPITVGNEQWWRAGVPRRAGRELAEDLKATQNLDIELAN